MPRHALVFATALALLALSAPTARAQSDPDMLSSAQLAFACALPPVTGPEPIAALRVAGGQDTVARTLFSNRDIVVINGGTLAGVQLGQRFFTKHQVAYGAGTAALTLAPHTTGWVRIVAVNDATAVATVDYACDGISVGDYLETFSLPLVPADADRPSVSGLPDFSSALGHVLFGNEARDTGVTGDFMMVDRGARQGMVPGVRLAVYRDLHVNGVPLSVVGDAVVVSTTDTMSVMRIVNSRDVVHSGDYVVQKK